MRKERIVNLKHIIEERELMKEVQEFTDIPSREKSKKGGKENGRSSKQSTRR